MISLDTWTKIQVPIKTTGSAFTFSEFSFHLCLSGCQACLKAFALVFLST